MGSCSGDGSFECTKPVNVEKHKGEETLCPKSIDVVKEAFEYVKNLEKSKAAKPMV